MYLANGSVQIANGSVRILNFAGSVPPASEINFAGPKTWDVKTDTAIWNKFVDFDNTLSKMYQAVFAFVCCTCRK